METIGAPPALPDPSSLPCAPLLQSLCTSPLEACPYKESLFRRFFSWSTGASGQDAPGHFCPISVAMTGWIREGKPSSLASKWDKLGEVVDASGFLWAQGTGLHLESHSSMVSRPSLLCPYGLFLEVLPKQIARKPVFISGSASGGTWLKWIRDDGHGDEMREMGGVGIGKIVCGTTEITQEESRTWAEASGNQGEKSAVPQPATRRGGSEGTRGFGSQRNRDLDTRVWSVIFPGQCGPDTVGEGD